MDFISVRELWQLSRTHECDDSSLQAKLVMEASFIGQSAMKGLDASKEELTKACANGSIVPQFAQTAAIGAGLAWMANSRLKLVGQGLTAVMGTQFVMDIAKSAGEVFGKGVDTWNNPENYQSNLKAASASAGHFIYENALGALGMPTGAVIGHAASKIHFNGFGYGQLKPAYAGTSANEPSISKDTLIDYSVGNSNVSPTPESNGKKIESAFTAKELRVPHELKTKDGEVLFSGKFVNLKEALETAVKEKVSLEGVNLSHHDIRGVDLSGANIENAKFVMANAEGAKFSGAIANGADFSGMRADGANFSGMLAKQAIFHLMEAKRADFSGMQAQKALFHKVEAEHADFTGANFENAFFQNVKATESNFTDANFDNANVLGTSFKDANLSGVHVGSIKELELEWSQIDWGVINDPTKVDWRPNESIGEDYYAL